VFVDVQNVQVQRRCPFEKIAIIVNDLGFRVRGVATLRLAQINNCVAAFGLGGSQSPNVRGDTAGGPQVRSVVTDVHLCMTLG
jgi:hypothetical protein